MKKVFYLLAIIVLTIIGWFLFSNGNKNTKKVDVSDIEIQLDLTRYEQQFQLIDTNNIIPSLQQLRVRDTIFFDFYTEQMMRFGEVADTMSPVILGIKEFLTNGYVQEMYDTTQEFHGDLSAYKSELTAALKHFKYYFPNKEIPKVYTVVSEFSYTAVTLDTSILVQSLEMYLGKNYKYYYSFDFPQYVVNRFETDYMVPNSMEALYNAHFAVDQWASTDAMIHAMIENGKRYYFMECMQPEKPRHLMIGYTAEQLAWCELEEANIWKLYNEKDLFYSKDYLEHKRHVNDGPLTPGMPSEAPGNVGSWVGWQIVNSYMDKADGKVSLAEMLATPPENILAKAGYKPK